MFQVKTRSNKGIRLLQEIYAAPYFVKTFLNKLSIILLVQNLRRSLHF